MFRLVALDTRRLVGSVELRKLADIPLVVDGQRTARISWLDECDLDVEVARRPIV